jgi:hypothetical protein
LILLSGSVPDYSAPIRRKLKQLASFICIDDAGIMPIHAGTLHFYEHFDQRRKTSASPSWFHCFIQRLLKCYLLESQSELTLTSAREKRNGTTFDHWIV